MNFGLTVKRMTATRSNRVLDEETLYAAVSLSSFCCRCVITSIPAT
jgi:hypothetical protein